MTDRKTFNVLRQQMEQTTSAVMEFTVANRASTINRGKTPFRADFMLQTHRKAQNLCVTTARRRAHAAHKFCACRHVCNTKSARNGVFVRLIMLARLATVNSMKASVVCSIH